MLLQRLWCSRSSSFLRRSSSGACSFVMGVMARFAQASCKPANDISAHAAASMSHASSSARCVPRSGLMPNRPVNSSASSVAVMRRSCSQRRNTTLAVNTEPSCLTGRLLCSCFCFCWHTSEKRSSMRLSINSCAKMSSFSTRSLSKSFLYTHCLESPSLVSIIISSGRASKITRHTSPLWSTLCAKPRVPCFSFVLLMLNKSLVTSTTAPGWSWELWNRPSSAHSSLRALSGSACQSITALRWSTRPSRP
mmetsp:Transcript_135718/g.329918  ORF Transcript_135718/g.329918 Transcript_135718/m.329918 type:complete len:251 (-) Transcript_135718:402-1154(-)